MENSDNKLITVYEIKPECDDDGNSLGGRDVLVEIVSSPEEHLLRGTATLSADGTLLIGSPDGNDLHTHLTIPGNSYNIFFVCYKILFLCSMILNVTFV